MVASSYTYIYSIILLFVSAIIGGLCAKKLRQPLILGYIISGILFGNIFPFIRSSEGIQMIADVGVTLLLFGLGIEFSFQRLAKVIRSVGLIVCMQIIIVSILIYIPGRMIGFSTVGALFLSSAISLSSTALLIKILSDHGDRDSIPSETAIGWLVLQDILVIPIMILLTAISINTSNSIASIIIIILGTLVKSCVVLGLLIVFGKFLIPKILDITAHIGSRELFLTTSLGIVMITSIASSLVGLSMSLGAFVAGLLISQTMEHHAVFSEIRPLRDIVAVIFFTSLGIMLPFPVLISVFPQVVFIVFLALCIKFFTVLILSNKKGFHRKTSFLVSLYLLPISEFGFIIAQLGRSAHMITQDQFIIIVSSIFMTFLLATPAIIRGQELYYLYKKFMGKKDHDHIVDHENYTPGGLPIENHVVICGYGRVGKYIGRALELSHVPYIVVDYNSSTIYQLKSKGIPVVYGDPADIDVLDYAQVDLAKILVIAIPDRHTQEMIITNAQTLNRSIHIYCRTHYEDDQKHLKSLGVQTIIQPEFEAAIAAVEKILPTYNISLQDILGKVTRLKIEHGL